MTQSLHLGDAVEVVTDKFAGEGAPKGSIGVIVDDWSDGSNDVQVSNAETGEVIARFRAAEDEIQPYWGPFTEKEPREHGILFGRGDDLPDDVEAPPMPARWGAINIPGYSPASMAFSEPPKEDIEVTGEIPWELREEPPSGPIFH
jgi:hypothetical protein